MKISKKILSMIMVVLLVVGMVPISAIAADTSETYTLTIKYAITSSNGVAIGDGIADEQITNIPPNTMLDLSDYWPSALSVDGFDGKTYYFAGFVENSNGDGTPIHFLKDESNKTLYAGWTLDSQVSISLDTNGGILDCKAIRYPKKFANIDRMNDKFVPVRDGYTFLGWSLENDGTADDTNIEIAEECTLYAVWEEIHSHCVCGGNTDIGDHTTHMDIEFIPWNSTNSMPTSTGHYVLMNNVTLSNSWEPADGTVLCLNGCTLYGYDIDVKQNHQFTLCDCGDGKITATDNSNPDMIYLFAGSTFNMYGGTIDGGGCMRVVTLVNAEFNMYNGTIKGGKATNEYGGGGVRNLGTFTMYGGSITGNTSETSGGGVYNNGTFTMNGGSITKNQSTQNAGGGVYNSSYATFTMNGGTVTNNSSKESGGGVQNDHIFVMTGGEIIENTSINSTGGGVWSATEAPISISGNAVITGNTGKEGPNNLHLASDGTDDAKITVSTMGTNASVGVSVDSNHAKIISEGGKDHKDKFFSDNGAYAIAVDGEDLTLVKKTVQVGQVTLADCEYTTNGEDKPSGTPTGTGYAYFENGVLTLNNFSYSGNNSNNTIIYSGNDLTIKLIGTNTLTNTGVGHGTGALRCVWVGRHITIEGSKLSDSLTVTTADQPTRNLSSVPICTTDGNLVITNCTVVSSAGDANDGNVYGLQSGDATIKNAVVEVNSGKSMELNSAGLSVYDLTITNSTITACSEDGYYSSIGISAYGIMTVTNSTIDAQSGSAETYYSYGISVGGDDAKLVWNIGTMLASCGVGAGGSDALYIETDQINFGQDYWWRTSASDEYTVGQYSGNNEDGSYLEITTTQPHICEWNTEWSSDENAHWHECLTVDCTISDNAQKDGYGLHDPNADDGDCSTAVACRICGAETTAAKSHSFTEPSTQIASKGDCQNPKTYYAKCTNCNTISDMVTVASSEYGVHKWDTKWTTDSNKHWHKCLNSGCTEIKDDLPHSGGTATCKDKAKCEFCDMAYGELDSYNHKYSTTLTWTDDEHFYECSLCSAKKDKALHDFTDDCDETCNTCGYVRVITHTFNKLEKDENGHWYICSVCETASPDGKEAHRGGTATCTVKAKCSECGEEYGNFGAHNWDINWATDSNKHWHKCLNSECTEIKDENAHSGGTATCKDKAKCEFCDTAYGELGVHGETEVRDKKEATCTEPGYTGDIYCTVCNEKIAGGDKIAATGHLNKETHNKKNATCTENGNTGDVWCIDCNAELEKGTVITAIGHDYENGKCTVCGVSDPNCKPISPQTGDSFGIWLWFMLLLISGMGITCTVIYDRKKRMN